jgi:hypothetical protein
MKIERTRGHHGGRQFYSSNGKLFLSFGGNIYLFHLSVYRLTFTIERGK